MPLKFSSSSLPTGNEVLVVEDQARVRDMLNHALKEMGFNATLTPTAEAALKALTQSPFDIVILDLNLPGMDGMEFLRCVRAQSNDIQVIILTGFGDLEAAKTAIHLDVVDFITKPYSLNSLEQALDRARKRIKAKITSGAATAADDFPEVELAEPSPRATFADAPPTGNDMEDVERRQILQVLEQFNGNRASAAAELGISLRKLYYRLGQYQKRGYLS